MREIATTIEQSKHLLELGLSKKTSDMSYSEEYFGRDKDGNDEWCWKLNACKFIDIEGIIPAWSLSALLEVIKGVFAYTKGECEKRAKRTFEYNPLDYYAFLEAKLKEDGFVFNEETGMYTVIPKMLVLF